jgi:hypothetical protein
MILNEDLLNDRPRMMKDAVGLIFVPKKGMGELQVCGNYIPLNRCLNK